MRFNPGLKLTLHLEYIDFLRGTPVYPINTEISISGVCNANCSMCFYKNNHTKKMIDHDSMIRTLKDYYGRAISWTGGGEPTLNKHFPEYVLIASQLGISQGLFTNALKNIDYDPKLFEWIRVSKTDRDFNYDNFGKLRECETVGIVINDTGNDKEIEDTLKVVYKYGLDYLQVRPALKTGGEYTRTRAPEIRDEKLIITEYKYKACSLPRTYDKCYGYNFVPFVWETGDVYTCAYHYGNEYYKLGNICELPFNQIIRTMPTVKDVSKDCQVCCKNNEINELIFDSLNINNGDFV